MPVPASRYSQGRGGAAPQAQTQKTVKPVARQQSLITRVYINLRWFHHFLPLLGTVLILYGIYLVLNDPEDLMVSWTVIGGGALISYLAIWYNKTR